MAYLAVGFAINVACIGLCLARKAEVVVMVMVMVGNNNIIIININTR
jgi:hypothetical protein